MSDFVDCLLVLSLHDHRRDSALDGGIGAAFLPFQARCFAVSQTASEDASEVSSNNEASEDGAYNRNAEDGESECGNLDIDLPELVKENVHDQNSNGANVQQAALWQRSESAASVK